MNKDCLFAIYSYGTSLYIPEEIIARESQNPFLENLRVTKIGYFKNAAGQSVIRSGINECILMYCVEGTGWLQTDGKQEQVGKGDLVFLEAKLPHSYHSDLEHPWSIYWMHFAGSGVGDIQRRLEVSNHSPILHVGVRTDLIMIMTEAIRTISNGYSFSDLFHAATCLQSFISSIYQIKTYAKLQSNNSFGLESLMHFMRQNIREVYTLEQLAEQMCMSKYHFARKFKDRTGYSPIDYFTRMKIQKACELLETTAIDIKEISAYLSFCNPFYFSEVFKKIIGHSPREYRSTHSTISKNTPD